jgi:uncharacterized cupredoxin-like copper-binding protein
VRPRLLVVSVVLAALAACTEVGASTHPPFDDAREVEVVATEFAFRPVEIAATVGEPVNVRLTNEGRIDHDLVSRELGLDVHARPRASEIVGFVPETAGRHELICSIPGHAREGMVMVLVVDEP